MVLPWHDSCNTPPAHTLTNTYTRTRWRVTCGTLCTLGELGSFAVRPAHRLYSASTDTTCRPREMSMKAAAGSPADLAKPLLWVVCLRPGFKWGDGWWGGVNVNALSLGHSNATEEQQVYSASHMGHAYATRCVYKYRVQPIAPTASGNV